jgi:hypothetical protein
MPRRPAVAVIGALILFDLGSAIFLARGLAGTAAAAATLEQGRDDQRAAVEARARGRSHAPVSAPTYSAYLSAVAFRSGQMPVDSAVKAGHSVWVVTVRYPNGGCEGCTLERPLRRHRTYSVVYDASTGKEVDYCGGCEWVKESRPDSAEQHVLAQAPTWLQELLARLIRARVP